MTELVTDTELDVLRLTRDPVELAELSTDVAELRVVKGIELKMEIEIELGF